MLRFAISLLVLALLLPAPAQAGPVVLNSGATQANIGAQVTYLRDPERTMTIENVQFADFAEHDQPNLSLGFTTDAVWLRFSTLSDPGIAPEWVLEIGHPLLDRVELFSATESGWARTLAGDMIAPKNRDLDLRSVAFNLPVQPGKEQVFYLRVTSKSSMLFPINLSERNQFLAQTLITETGFGLFYGGLIIMALYNLALYLSIRDSNYLLYSLTVISTTLFQATLSGHAPYYIWPQHMEWTNSASLYSLICTIGFGMWFSIRFLDTRKNAPMWHWAMVVVILCGLALAPMDWIIGYSATISLGARFSVVAGLIALFTGIWCLRKHVYSAKFYVLARTGLCIGSILTAGRQLGAFPDIFIMEHGMRIGSLAESLLLAFALSDRYNQLRAEKDAAQKQTADELRRLDKLKDEILANTSHELRTPLHGIIGVTESMLDGATGKLNKSARHNLAMVATSAKRLARLVDDILDFSRLRTHDLRLDPKPLDLRVAADVVVTLLQPMVRGRPVTLTNLIEPDTHFVLADEARLQQILSNIVGNAVKFTDEGEITVRAVPGENDICVEISDTGIGIPKEAHDRVFQSFEQAEGSDTRLRGGTGLGLSVTRSLVELQGGKIFLKSEPGEGSTFSFTLPLAPDDIVADTTDTTIEPTNITTFVPEEEFHTEDLAPLSAADSGYRILVVDDEPINQQVLANHLTLANYSVSQALNGQEALNLLESGQTFDLVLLDVMMPRMSGYEVCERIRQSHLATELPIIMVTAKSQVSDLVTGLGVGANDYIGKPFTKQVLLARIKTHLNLLKINSAYGKFVPQDFLRHLGKESIIDVELGDNVELEMAILWSDIRKFTTLTEAMTPGECFDFINSYFSRMGPVIRQHDGLINSFIGDAIMAMFVTGADAAVTAALASAARLDQYNQERKSEGHERINVGFAVHIGTVRLGIVGEAKRRQGEVFSDAINLTSRLEALTKSYGVRLIISAEVSDQLAPEKYSLLYLDRVRVKGRIGEIDIFEVLDGLTDQTLRETTRSDFEKAVSHKLAGQHELAADQFRAILASNPQDRPAQYHLDTLEQLLLNERRPSIVH